MTSEVKVFRVYEIDACLDLVELLCGDDVRRRNEWNVIDCECMVVSNFLATLCFDYKNDTVLTIDTQAFKGEKVQEILKEKGYEIM